MPNIPGIDVTGWIPMIGQIVYWSVYAFIGMIMIGGMYFIYSWITFDHKITIWKLYGSGKDGIFSFDKPKTNKIKWIKKKKAWEMFWPLFNKKEYEPFDSEYIYPGLNCYAFELNNQLIPARINIKETEKTIRAELNPVPYYVRNWQSLEHKKDQVEFAEKDWWQENKGFVYMLVAVAICCTLCGLTIYLSYKFAFDGRQDVQMLTNAIKGFGNIPAK
jgi:hypothetical protein